MTDTFPASLAELLRAAPTAPDADTLRQLWTRAETLGCHPTGELGKRIRARARELGCPTPTSDEAN